MCRGGAGGPGTPETVRAPGGGEVAPASPAPTAVALSRGQPLSCVLCVFVKQKKLVVNSIMNVLVCVQSLEHYKGFVCLAVDREKPEGAFGRSVSDCVPCVSERAPKRGSWQTSQDNESFPFFFLRHTVHCFFYLLVLFLE